MYLSCCASGDVEHPEEIAKARTTPHPILRVWPLFMTSSSGTELLVKNLTVALFLPALLRRHYPAPADKKEKN